MRIEGGVEGGGRSVEREGPGDRGCTCHAPRRPRPAAPGPLATARVGRPTLRYDRVTSTMALAHELARAGATDGTAVLAEEQAAGRGRRGRAWVAPRGTALLCSLVLRPPPAVGGAGASFALTAAVSVGLCLGVEEATGLRPAIKWPNDLLLGGRKLAGVLCETRFLGAALDYAVVGFGLNVSQRPEELPGPAPRSGDAGGAAVLAATSLAIELGAGRAVERGHLLAAALARIDGLYDLLRRGRGDEVLARWRAHLAGLGAVVRIETEAGAREGVFAGVDEDGALRLATARGTERILAGEVVLGPRAVV